MVKSSISPSRQLGFTPLYLDFLAGRTPARDFYLAPSPAAAAEAIDRRKYDRTRLADILHRQNAVFGAGHATHTNIDKLTDSRTVAVLAGQQAGLLGGPMYAIIKALAVARRAERYSAELSRPVVPIFWIAGDDHDFEEINHTTVLSRTTGELCEIRYGTEPEASYPASQIRFSDADELERALNRLRECLGESDFTPELYDAVRLAYSAEDTFVTAFGKLMARLTEKYGVIFFDPGDADGKDLARPFLTSLLEKHDQVQAILNQRSREIESAGYHVQVHKLDRAVHLFFNTPGRTPVWRDSDTYVCGDERFERSALLEMITNEPHRFSPDVLTRPLMQSYIFPTLVQIGGPSEIAYLAQLNPLFALFEIPTPYYLARPGITLIEKRFEKVLDDNGISFEDLTGDIEQVVNRIMEKSFPKELEQGLRNLRNDIGRQITDFAKSSLTFEPSLAEFAKQTSGKVDFALNAFSEKVFAAHKRKDKETRERIYRTANALYPNRGLQERTLNITYFIAKYGFGVVSFLYDNLGNDGSEHRVVHLGRMEGQ